MNAIRTFFGFLITITIGAFAVMNAQTIELTWSPLHPPLNLPLHVPLLVALALGFFIGATTVWLNDGKVRREKRVARRHIRELEKKLETNQNYKESTDHSADFFPSLPAK